MVALPSRALSAILYVEVSKSSVRGKQVSFVIVTGDTPSFHLPPALVSTRRVSLLYGDISQAVGGFRMPSSFRRSSACLCKKGISAGWPLRQCVVSELFILPYSFLGVTLRHQRGVDGLGSFSAQKSLRRRVAVLSVVGNLDNDTTGGMPN